MRTHLTNFLGRLGLTDEGAQVQSSDEDVEHIPRPIKRKVERAHTSVESKRASHLNPTPLEHRHTKRVRQIHTAHQGKSGATAPLAHASPSPNNISMNPLSGSSSCNPKPFIKIYASITTSNGT